MHRLWFAPVLAAVPASVLAVVPASVLAAAACSGTPPRPVPQPVASAAPAPPPPAPPAKKPPPPLPLREDETGIAGAPRDDTSFEYDVEPADVWAEPRLDGIPGVSRGVARALQPYLETRRAKLAAISSDAREMLVLTRLAETTQVHQVRAPLGMRRQLTFGPEPVEQATFVPSNTRRLSYRSDVGGTEAYQIYLLDLASRATHRLSEAGSRHGPFRWSSSGSLAFTNNARNGRDMDVYVIERAGQEARRVAEREGQWVVLGWARDGRRLLMQEFFAADQSMLHILDVQTGESFPLAPTEAGISTKSGIFSIDGQHVLAVSTRGRDTSAVFQIHLATRAWTPLTPNIEWDVEEVAQSSNGKTLVYSVNEDGYSALFTLQLPGGKPRRLYGLPKGVISGLRFVGPSQRVAFTLGTPTEATDAYIYDLNTAQTTRWTESEVGGLPQGQFVAPEVVRVRSFDALDVPAFYFRPRGKGPFPVLIWIHGGPEGQFRPQFDPILQYYVATRGIAVIAPNVRGSTGYGLRYMGLDDGFKRRDAIRDLGAVLDWIAARPELNTSRVGIYGASYGGFMVLAALTEYRERLVAGASAVGMSNLVTFLEQTSEYRRDLRRVEYGDERDPEVRTFLSAISPLHRADEIRSALLVAHGESDPRVPLAEAEAVVRAVRGAGLDAWFFVARGEGHSFKKRRNRDAFYYTLAEFFERYLVRGEAATSPAEASPEAEVETNAAKGGPLRLDPAAPDPTPAAPPSTPSAASPSTPTSATPNDASTAQPQSGEDTQSPAGD